MVGGHREAAGQENCKWLVGLGRAFFFPVPWFFPKNLINCFRRLFVNALNFSIIMVNIFSQLYKPFHHDTEPSLLSKQFPLPFHKNIEIGLPWHFLVASYFIIDETRKIKEMSNTPYKSITFLGDHQFTTKSFWFAITDSLRTCFTKVLIFDRFCFPPFTCFTSLHRSIL